ncbi:hypothetical protein JKF63_01976 [Porcisia hertigi]|uniref:GRIP domain-containing protein n=1 Tax=Porcisia hertigi TaxID=2761500 RepID=A0A836IBJ9_9TRYP|nr:hypothetical protein JKF63_01976 [Porcisia hertigi]
MRSSTDQSENTTGAPTTDDAAAKLPSSTTATVPTEEVAQLKRQLHDCQEKFELWKVKAKAGVDQMRSQIVDITRALNESKQQCAHLAALAYNADAPTSVYVSQSQNLMYAHAMAAACLLVDAVSAPDTGGGQEPCDGSAATNLSSSRHIQRTNPHLLQKTIEDQSNRLKEVRRALQQLTNELQQRTEALRQQDDNVAALRRQLAALEACKTSLEQQLANAPDAEQWRQAQEDLDQQLVRMQLEYEGRESQLILQHSTELQALNAAHEQEIREMERERNEAVAQALRNCSGYIADKPAGRSAPLSRESDGNHNGKADDDAYIDLLNDYKRIKMRCAAVVKERDHMETQQKAFVRELRGLLSCTARSLPASKGNSAANTGTTDADRIGLAVEWDSLSDTATMEDVTRHLCEQRLRFKGIQEELARTHQEVTQLRRLNAGHSADGLSAQQVQYLRSVVVQLLCSLSDVNVVRHMLPVLCMLLKFSDGELKAITNALPHSTGNR